MHRLSRWFPNLEARRCRGRQSGRPQVTRKTSPTPSRGYRESKVDSEIGGKGGWLSPMATEPDVPEPVSGLWW